MKTLIAITAVLAALIGCATQAPQSPSYAIVLTSQADFADAGTSVVIPGFSNQKQCEAALIAKGDEIAQSKISGVISARCALVQS